MVQDSAGFQSQQFVEQVEQRRDRYSQQNIDTARNTWGQVGDLPGKFMQARGVALEQQMRLSQVANDLANDQLHRQQAQEDLLWSQQLHQADMIELQKRGMAAEIALKEAQTNKAIDELGGSRSNGYWNLNAEQRDAIIEDLGWIGSPNGKGVDMVPADDKLRAEAGERRKTRRQQEQADALEQIRERNKGHTTSESLESGRRMQLYEDQIKLLETQIDNLPKTYRGMPQEERDALKKMEADLREQIRKTAAEGARVGGGAKPASQEPEQTVEAEDPSVQQAMVNELDALHKSLDSVLGGPK